MFWLLTSFLLGVITLISDVTIASPKDPDSEAYSWSFGQIMPVILLAIPFITIVENLYPDEAPVRDLHTEATRDISSSSLLPWPEERHDEDNSMLVFNPDQDYYHISSSMKAGTISIFIFEVFLGCFAPVAVVLTGSFMENILHRANQTIPGAFFSLWCIILFSLGIDWVVSQKAGRGYVPKRHLLVLLQFANVTLFTAFPMCLMLVGDLGYA